MSSRRPSRTVLIAFAAIVLIGGTNIVAVRFSNRELDPFWGAGLRFTVSSILLWGLVAHQRLEMPRGEALRGAAIFGVLSFLLAYAFFYWGAQEVPAGLAGTIMASVPLLTVLLAAAHRLEALRSRAVGGALLAIVGIGLMSSGALAGAVSVVSIGAIVVAAASAAESGVVLKLIPPSHPVVTNAVAMTVGSVLLLLLSLAVGERWELPRSPAVWTAVAYLMSASPALFILYVFVVRRWTASAASFQFVLFPLVSVSLGALLLDEPLTLGLLLGAPLVLLGVYAGALSRPVPTAEEDPVRSR
jgi:drug/metabolite transporter (DMT)-like permease